MVKILEKYTLGPGIEFAELEAPMIAKKAEPGQFVIVTHHKKSERIPLTIADFNREKGTISLVFQKMGKGTHKLAELNAGDEIYGVLGPQGNPTHMDNNKNVVVVGGGIGIAPVYPIARKLKELGNNVIAIIGYRSKDHVFWEEKMKVVSDELLIATNDGSYGEKGFVTNILKEVMGRDKKIDKVYAIGPAVMMKAVAEMTKTDQISTDVSLNSLMVCGMGMCGACRVTVDGKTKFTCMDGPEFDGHLVDFDELMIRLGTYKNEELEIFDNWKAEEQNAD
jgi:sulfide dehydrogenase subunit beta